MNPDYLQCNRIPDEITMFWIEHLHQVQTGMMHLQWSLLINNAVCTKVNEHFTDAIRQGNYECISVFKIAGLHNGYYDRRKIWCRLISIKNTCHLVSRLCESQYLTVWSSCLLMSFRIGPNRLPSLVEDILKWNSKPLWSFVATLLLFCQHTAQIMYTIQISVCNSKIKWKHICSDSWGHLLIRL